MANPQSPFDPVPLPTALSDSPVHDYVRANQDTTADDVSRRFRVSPKFAQVIIDQVRSQGRSRGQDNGSGNLGMTPTPTSMGSGNLGTTPQPADMGSGDLGTAGPSPIPRVSGMPPMVPASSSSPGPVAAAFNPPYNPAMRPPSAQIAPGLPWPSPGMAAVPPPSMPSAGSYGMLGNVPPAGGNPMAPAPLGGLGIAAAPTPMMSPQDMAAARQRYIASLGPSPGSTAPSVSFAPPPTNQNNFGQAAPPILSQQPPASMGYQPHRPSWQDIIAPFVGAALIGHNKNVYMNPQADFINGWQHGQDKYRAEQAGYAQQNFENRIKQQTADAATSKASTSLSKSEMDMMKAAPDAGAALAFYDSIDPTNSRGLRSIFYDDGGQLKKWNPFSKDAARIESTENNNNTKNDLLKQHYGEQVQNAYGREISQYSGNPDAQKQVAMRYDKQFGTTDFTDSLGQGTGPTDKQTDADRRITLYGDQVRANIGKINEQAGLIQKQGKYIEAKTGRVVPDSVARDRQLNAAARYLGVEADDKPGLDAVTMALGNAHVGEADANTDYRKMLTQVMPGVYQNLIDTRSGNLDVSRIRTLADLDRIEAAASKAGEATVSADGKSMEPGKSIYDLNPELKNEIALRRLQLQKIGTGQPGGTGQPTSAGPQSGRLPSSLFTPASAIGDLSGGKINTLANRHGIPPTLLQRLIIAENSGFMGKDSPKGAIGYMQLMPATAKALGVNPRDPQQNLEGGARYLRQMYDRYGDWTKAVAAYNAGPGAVDKYGGVPPFKETQAYVRSILGTGSVPPGGIPRDIAGNPLPATPRGPVGAAVRNVRPPYAPPLPAAPAMRQAGRFAPTGTPGITIDTTSGIFYKNGVPTGHRMKMAGM